MAGTVAIEVESKQNNGGLEDKPPPATAGKTTMVASPRERIHYLDNLRALAMLLGVLLHGGLAYANPAQMVWLATDTGASVTVDAAIWFIHLFRMGLFYLLSGYFAKLVIERKGRRKFTKQRMLRLALPFVIFYPVLLAGMTIAIVFAIAYLEKPLGLMGVIAGVAKGEVDSPAGSQSLTTMHLWFIYYLFVFSAVAVVCSYVSAKVADHRKDRPIGEASIATSRKLSLRLLLPFAPLVLVPSVLVAGIPLPAPESFKLQFWPFGFYGLFFLAGWKWYGREKHLERLQPHVWKIAIASLVLFIPYYWLMPTLDIAVIESGKVDLTGWRLWVESALTAYLSVLLTLLSLLLGMRFLTRRNSLLGFISDSSYWVYLVHLPLTIFLQTLLIPFDWPVFLKLATVLIGTAIPCLITYVVFVRYTPLGWMLHGKRSFP